MNDARQDLIRYRMDRAEETLAAARIMAQSEHWCGCVNRVYYACFYAVSALLLARGLSSSKHSGVRALFNQHFVKTGTFPRDLAAFYNQLYERRLQTDHR